MRQKKMARASERASRRSGARLVRRNRLRRVHDTGDVGHDGTTRSLCDLARAVCRNLFAGRFLLVATKTQDDDVFPFVFLLEPDTPPPRLRRRPDRPFAMSLHALKT